MIEPDAPEDAEEHVSAQPLGEGMCTVVYAIHYGVVVVYGALVSGAEYADRDEFSRRRLEAWRKAIQAEEDSANRLPEPEVRDSSFGEFVAAGGEP